MRGKIRNGYTLLFNLLVLSSLIMYTLILFRCYRYNVSVPTLHLKALQLEYAAQGLLEYAIAFCQENKSKLFDKKTSKNDIHLSADPWMTIHDTVLSGTLVIRVDENNVGTITAKVTDKNKSIQSASCCITPRGADGSFLILDVSKWRS